VSAVWNWGAGPVLAARRGASEAAPSAAVPVRNVRRSTQAIPYYDFVSRNVTEIGVASQLWGAAPFGRERTIHFQALEWEKLRSIEPGADGRLVALMT
jgi:hypothetical protein